MRQIVKFQKEVPLIRQKMSAVDGFNNDDEAIKFGNNACGAACLKMVFESFSLSYTPSVKELMEEGIREKNFKELIGWVHDGLVAMIKKYGLSAERENIFLKPEKIAEKLQENNLIIASVSLGFNQDKRGGHLIVIYGIAMENRRLDQVLFRDPSGWGQTHSSIDSQSFLNSWTGNVIFVNTYRNQAN